MYQTNRTGNAKTGKVLVPYRVLAGSATHRSISAKLPRTYTVLCISRWCCSTRQDPLDMTPTFITSRQRNLGIAPRIALTIIVHLSTASTMRDGDTESTSLLSHKYQGPGRNVRRYLNETVDVRHAPLNLLVCCFLVGLVDAATYNTWSVFMSMQTGMPLSQARLVPAC